MSARILKNAIFVGACAFAVVAATPSRATPVLTSTAMIKASMPSQVTDVRYVRRGYAYRGYRRGLGYGGAPIVGLGLGLLGAAAAAPYYGYYGGPAYYGPGYGYYGAPAYYGPGYYRRGYYRHW